MSRFSVCVGTFLLFIVCALQGFAQEASDPDSAASVPPPATITGSGTVNFIPKFTGASTIGNSVIFQSGGAIGIGTTTPATRLDVKGPEAVRDILTLFPNGTHPTLRVNGTAFAVSNLGRVTFVAGQTFPGTVTNVTAGTGLTGGGTGTPTLSLNTSFTDGRYAQLGAFNTFTADQDFLGNIFASGFLSVGDIFSLDIFPTTVNPSTGDAPSVTANNNGVTQTVQMQNFVSGFGYIEAQFNSGGTATFFTDNAGDTTAIGTKSAAVPLQNGKMVKVFSMESPEVWFEDFGSAQMIGGVGVVSLDLSFAQTTNLQLGYHVFVTPKGDCRGLYVTNQTGTGFEVRELGGGQSTVAFDYRIVAHRNGYEKMRLPVARIPRMGALKAPVRPIRPR